MAIIKLYIFVNKILINLQIECIFNLVVLLKIIQLKRIILRK